MCGISGFMQQPSAAVPEMLACARQMADALVHRGPDDAGAWCDPAHGIALSHRRLAILDLSPAGHQPMESASSRYVIAFNGEIYNHLALRDELGAQAWRGHSDTETLLVAIEQWGLLPTLQKVVGMFAFALWDRREKSLTLARDRFGEKPLYYGLQKGVLLFGSELKALREHPAFEGGVDRDVLSLYFRYNYIPAPYSVYRGIHKLEPGCLLTVRSPRDQLKPIAYWSLQQVAESGQRNLFGGDEGEAVDELERLMRQAVRDQMLADVPLGALLSGGIDSSAVVALMQAESSRPVKTFTIGFDEEGYDEATHARAVARHLGTEHTELRVSSAQALAVIPDLPRIYDEPFSDSSQIPTWLVASLAREHVAVCLSGDGGDEAFGGYNRYFIGARLWQKVSRLPAPLRQMLSRLLLGVPPERWNAVIGAVSGLLPARVRFGNPGDKLHKLAGVLGATGPEAFYHGLVSHCDEPAGFVRGSVEPRTLVTDLARWPALSDFPSRMMAVDAQSYLPDDILCKVDRAAMSVSLETRVPYLDHRVVEFAWHLPLDMKVRGGQGKHVLRQMLYRYVPAQLMERPKTGFAIPLHAWLRGPLRDWAETLLEEGRLRREGFVQPAPVRRMWREHLSGQRNWQYPLWDVLMLQAWLEATGHSS